MLLNLVASPKVAALVAAAESDEVVLTLKAEVLNTESEENQGSSSELTELSDTELRADGR